MFVPVTSNGHQFFISPIQLLHLFTGWRQRRWMDGGDFPVANNTNGKHPIIIYLLLRYSYTLVLVLHAYLHYNTPLLGRTFVAGGVHLAHLLLLIHYKYIIVFLCHTQLSLRTMWLLVNDVYASNRPIDRSGTN